MKICIIEDHQLMGVALKRLIRDVESDADIMLFDNFPEGLTAIVEKKFDVLILDIDIPGGENMGMIKILKNKQPDIRILVNSGYDEYVYALPCLQAGADGFLHKTAPIEEFYLAFKSVINKKKYVSKFVQNNLLNNLRGDHGRHKRNPLKSLSPKEILVMQYLVEGKWTKEIAATMHIKVNTVSTYKRRIFDKLEVNDELELAKRVSLFKNL